MLLTGKAAPQLAAAEARGQTYADRLDLAAANTQAQTDMANKQLQLRLDMLNEQRGAARNQFFQEALTDFGQYRGAKRQEDFLKDLYNFRFGNNDENED
jgi:hypothetical protein